MNAKLAKRMRQHARRLMAGAPVRRLVAAAEFTKNVQAGTDQNGTPRVHAIRVASQVNDRKTVRGFYRDMKKGWAHKGIQ